eukprot:7213125-Pyramimonas_sp.AAC.1
MRRKVGSALRGEWTNRGWLDHCGLGRSWRVFHAQAYITQEGKTRTGIVYTKESSLFGLALLN